MKIQGDDRVLIDPALAGLAHARLTDPREALASEPLRDAERAASAPGDAAESLLRLDTWADQPARLLPSPPVPSLSADAAGIERGAQWILATFEPQ